MDVIQTRDSFAYRAKLAELAERYDVMLDLVAQMVDSADMDRKSGSERRLIVSAVEHATTRHRTMIRKCQTFTSPGQHRDLHPQVAKQANELLEQLVAELSGICAKSRDVCQKMLHSQGVGPVDRAFYNKLIGDCLRYERKAEAAMEAYTNARSDAKKGGSKGQVAMMGSILGQALVYYELKKDTKTALDLLRESTNDVKHSDQTAGIYLIRIQENISEWESELAGQQPDGLEWSPDDVRYAAMMEGAELLAGTASARTPTTASTRSFKSP